MRIARVQISNFLGIKNLEFDAGTFNEVSGRNGSGKTSVLHAIKAVLEGGEDATLLRRGEEKGEAVLILDDGTHIRKKITAKGTTLTVDKDGVKAQRPQSIIAALTDMLSVNPVDFLRAPKKQRVNVLLESIPMTADIERLTEIVGHKPDVAAGAHALTAIDSVYKAVFDDRTGTNRAIREKRATINQLEAAVPTVNGEMMVGDVEELIAERDALVVAKDAELARIETKLKAFRATSEQKRDSIRTAHETEIARLRALVQAEQDTMAAELDAERAVHADVESKAGKQRELTITKLATARQPIDAQITAVQQGQDTAARARVTRQTIAAMETEAAALDADAASQTAALTALEAYKSELLSQLPIDGLEVSGGEISRHGIAFDRLNSGQQVEIAVEIAKLRAGKLGVIAVDGIELLDSEHYAEFREQMEGTGLQMFVARVTDGDFAVTVD